MLEPALLATLMEEVYDDALCRIVLGRMDEMDQPIEVDIDAI